MFLELTLMNNNSKLMYPGLYMGYNDDDNSEILHTQQKYNLYRGMKTHMHINLSRIYNWFRLLCESLGTLWGLMYRVIFSSYLPRAQACPTCPTKFAHSVFFLMICFRLQRFTADFRDLTSWVTEMKALINADELANDVAGAEALLDRHQEHKVKSSKL